MLDYHVIGRSPGRQGPRSFVFAWEWPVGPLFCRLGLQRSLFDKAYLPNVLLYLEPF